MATLYEELGGEPVLRKIINTFVDRCFADPMIGFFFANADKERIKTMEFSHAAQHLGGGKDYAGRPIEKAHNPHPIREGHFNRRRQLLKDVLDEYHVDSKIQRAWLEHQEGLRERVINRKNPIC